MGIFQHTVAENSRDLTGFAIPGKGIFRFKVLPFGLKVAATIFQHIIEEVLQKEIVENDVQVYIDDIAIGATCVSELIEKCIRVFDRLTEVGLEIQWEKTRIGVSSLKYLGFVISRGQIHPDPEKVQALMDTKRPSTRKELVSFLASARDLAEHIPFFAFIEKRLHEKSLGKGKLLWDDEDDISFVRLKTAIANAVSLNEANPDEPFHLFVDASNIGVGAALAQRRKNTESWVYLKFVAQRFNSVQQRWDTTDKELYAIMYGLEKCDTFIKGAKVIVYTDHQALTHLKTSTKAKLVRYALRIAQHQPEIRHIRGIDNSIADWLSRALPDCEEPETGYSCISMQESGRSYMVPTVNRMYETAKAEEDLPPGVEFKNGTAIYTKENKLYVPRLHRPALLLLVHGSRYTGHVGIKKCVQILRRHLWWPGMQEDVQEWIRGCVLCQALRKSPTKSGLPGSLSAMGVGEVISVDYYCGSLHTVFDRHTHIVSHRSFCIRSIIHSLEAHLRLPEDSVLRQHAVHWRVWQIAGK